jgi:peptide/nickel transport system permease protein
VRPPPWWRSAARRVLVVLAQLLLVLVLVFGLSLLMPGDAADVQSGDLTSAAQRQETRELLGLDVAPLTRFLDWVGGVLTGDLGHSLASGRPVGEVIGQPFLLTALLAGLTTLLLVPVAGGLGYLAGLRPGSRRDRWITTTSMVLDSVPDFVLATLLVTYLALDLGWFPATFLGLDAAGALREPAYLVLPLVVMVARTSAPLVRLVRAGVADQLRAPYVVQAERLGVPRRSLLVRHVGPHALAPAMQELGRTGDGLVSGVLIVEAIFAVPGVATTLIDGVGNRDEPVVLAIVLITGTATVLVNALIDAAARRMVPRREGA